MSGDPEPAGAGDSCRAGSSRIAVAGFAVIVAGGALPGNPGAPGRGGRGCGRGRARPRLLVYVPRLPLLAAAVATAAIAVEGDGLSSDIGWLAACLLAGWCVIVVGQRDGLIYWAGSMILFAVEWLWIRPDPGWGAWLAGSTLTVAVLAADPAPDRPERPAASGPGGLAEQARTRNATASPASCTTSSGTRWWSPCCTCRARGWPWSTTRPTPRGRWPRRSGWAGSAWPRSGRRPGCSARTTAGAGGRAPRRCRVSKGCPRWWSSSGRRARTSPSPWRAIRRLARHRGLAVYRIAQEALTNAAKHAPGAPTAVRLSVGPGG